MITLNDYLYNGDTVVKILHRYSKDLRESAIPTGENTFFDNAYERGMILQQLELNKVDVNMFGAVDNSLVNDGCGLYRGRQILPYEHLSRFQNDLV